MKNELMTTNKKKKKIASDQRTQVGTSVVLSTDYQEKNYTSNKTYHQIALNVIRKNKNNYY